MESTQMLSPYLVNSVYILIGILIFLLSVSFAVRGLEIFKTNKFNSRRSVASNLLFDYLAGNIDLQSVSAALKEHGDLYAVVVKLGRELANDLEGDERDKLEEVFHLPQIYNHFLKKLESDDIGEIAKALVFFQSTKKLSSPGKDKIFELIEHQDPKIAYAATFSISAADDKKLKARALKKVSTRKDISSVALLELLFALAPEVDDLNGGPVFLQRLIEDNEIHTKNKEVLIRGVGDLNYLENAPYLFDLLKDLLSRKENNEGMVAACIEALGKLYSPKVLGIIQELIDAGSKKEKLSCAKALGALGDSESVRLLEDLLDDSYEEVRLEALKQLKILGPQTLPLLSGRNGKKIPVMKAFAIKELQEQKKADYA